MVKGYRSGVSSDVIVIVNWNVPPCEDEKFGRLWLQLKTTDPDSPDYDALLSELQA